MESRESCERRAWRLAVLLTLDQNAARRVVDEVAAAQPDLTSLPVARLERLVVLRAREHMMRRIRRRIARPPKNARPALIQRLRSRHRAHRRVGAGAGAGDVEGAGGRPAPGAGPIVAGVFRGEAAAPAEALGRLSCQQREAWVLGTLDGRELIDVARAMDCSRTAAARFAQQADGALREWLGEGLESAAAAIRGQADALEPAVFTGQGRARRRRRLAASMVVAGGAAVVAAGAWLLWR